MGDFRDLNTNHVKERTCAAVAASSFEDWYADYAQRAELLGDALENYNDGRMKRFLCELFIQEELPFLREIMRQAAALAGTPKEKGAAFKRLVSSMRQ